MYKIIVLILTVITMVLGQYHHRAVLENAAEEERLHPQLKNPFYRTPRVREALARSSWFGPGESPVHERQAEKIPRSEIYAVLTHAGLVPRRGFT